MWSWNGHTLFATKLSLGKLGLFRIIHSWCLPIYNCKMCCTHKMHATHVPFLSPKYNLVLASKWPLKNLFLITFFCIAMIILETNHYRVCSSILFEVLWCSFMHLWSYPVLPKHSGYYDQFQLTLQTGTEVRKFQSVGNCPVMCKGGSATISLLSVFQSSTNVVSNCCFILVFITILLLPLRRFEAWRGGMVKEIWAVLSI